MEKEEKIILDTLDMVKEVQTLMNDTNTTMQNVLKY